MKHLFPALLLAATSLFSLTSCQTAPPIGYENQPEVVVERHKLKDELLLLLPEAQRTLPEAVKEAQLLADTSYTAAAAIGRINQPRRWPAWRNNKLVNSLSDSALDRGLCWHYQHDMYRELRRLNLQFFAIGCCVYKRKTGREHNCVYLKAADDTWPNGIILDAWRLGGRLLTIAKEDIDTDDWQDRADTTEWLDAVYPVGHSYPIEHWATVRSDDDWNHHIPSYDIVAQQTKQGKRMQENIRQGLKTRNGKPTPY